MGISWTISKQAHFFNQKGIVTFSFFTKKKIIVNTKHLADRGSLVIRGFMLK